MYACAAPSAWLEWAPSQALPHRLHTSNGARPSALSARRPPAETRAGAGSPARRWAALPPSSRARSRRAVPQVAPPLCPRHLSPPPHTADIHRLPGTSAPHMCGLHTGWSSAKALLAYTIPFHHTPTSTAPPHAPSTSATPSHSTSATNHASPVHRLLAGCQPMTIGALPQSRPVGSSRSCFHTPSCHPPHPTHPHARALVVVTAPCLSRAPSPTGAAGTSQGRIKPPSRTPGASAQPPHRQACMCELDWCGVVVRPLPLSGLAVACFCC